MLAIFSFRYDAHLVPDLLQNISAFVDGWVCWDDRASADLVSSDLSLRLNLLNEAHRAGADWVLRVDPDERFERALAGRIDDLTAWKLPVAWQFNLRELYTPDSYRVDGLWGRKRQGRLFPLFDFLFPAGERGWFPAKEFHSSSHPRWYWRRHTGLDLYHLKMIEPRRRVHRRDLYAALDPENRFQPTGYGYLADEAGVELQPIEEGRGYDPPHREDGGLWMPESLPSAGLGAGAQGRGSQIG